MPNGIQSAVDTVNLMHSINNHGNHQT